MCEIDYTMRTIFWFLATVIFACIANLSIAQNYYVEVDSYGNYDVSGKSFCVLSGDEKVADNDLQFREFAEYIEQAMIMKGARVSKTLENAELVLLLRYGLSDESYTTTRSIPTRGQTGATIKTNSSTYGNAYGNVSVTGNNSTTNAYGNAYGNSTTNTTTTITPTYGITGYMSVESRVEQYRRNFELLALESSKPEQLIFKLLVTSEGYNDDLRAVYPILVYTSIKYIGESTGVKKEFKIKDTDPTLNLFAEKKFIHPKVTYKPKYINRSLKHPSVKIMYAQSNNEELILCLYNTENTSWHVPAKNTFLITENGAHQLSKVDGGHYMGGALSAKTQYVILHFDGDFEGVKKFNLVEYTDKKQTKKGYEFVGVTLTK